MNKNEHRELHAIVANVRDDRLRMLVYKLLEHVDEDDLDDEPESESDDEPKPKRGSKR